MFNKIAHSYDFLNHFLSFGVDVLWRRKLIKELLRFRPEYILDVATGTADVAIMAAKRGVARIVGVDLSQEMINVGQKKVKRKKLDSRIMLAVGDAENLCFNSNSYDAVVVSFGARNFENLNKGLLEMNRVLRSGSPLFVLEFSKPTLFPFKQFFYFYSHKFLPFIGRLVSKDARAYSYLPESIEEFVCGDDFLRVLEACNFESCYRIPLSFERATIYVGIKK